ncbi:molybdopterin-dependent oxidoreductase [Nocardia seriolae]|uniref:Molybdopterin-binding oxidoreductase n=1 Tax=Nocardia seriolae TaxID=37332 RepID=A0A0B8N9I7_9NOCA|nr:molybdopterin-dependent oxidoreductase [Nocardia seriolae]MTJ60184.1 molybdopterin-dependent oxidoreductase [Nocardia seriolae]MTJ76350.1 molybdopterin-dependent oxidoreductase [Nocardia seriolae]MTJ85179.1 molybdopterin-dependent oxidoreductase [Nocardia seriolae]MTK29175.1 molybdopterin-dependent oxidoreductase [Nocardia seriolae]MTK38115.1 molybdopterin-dependent oxidoreductase [Nocardia seriolae]
MTHVTDSPRTLLRTCPLCEAVCGLELTLDPDDRIVSVRGDHADPFSKGFICPKGATLGALDSDPDRLTAPMIRDRATDSWRTASWDEAFEVIRERLPQVSASSGNSAVGLYLGNPNAHTVAGALYVPLLIRALGSRSLFSASTADQMPKQVSSGLMFGDPLTVAVPDLDRTDYLLMLGANPLESNGSLCTAPDFPGRLKALRQRGGRLVVDPRRTRTAKLADEHLFVRPGSDAYLLFGIVHTLFAEDLVDIRVEVNGLDEVRAAAAEFTPELVAQRSGVPAATIVRIARELAAAPSAAVYARIGTCTAEFGTLTQWLVDVVNVLTGNLDSPGGAMFATGAALGIVRSRPFRTARWGSRVRGLPEAMGELPVATLADEILTPGEGQIRAMVTVAGNPVLSAPSGARLDAAFAGLEFMVSVDRYLNETTRYADVILPPPRIAQSPHYDFALLNFAVHNYARYSRPLVPLGAGEMSEAEVLARLALAVSGQRPQPGLDPLTVVDEIVIAGTLHKAGMAERRGELIGANTTEQRIDMMLRLGPFGDWAATPDGSEWRGKLNLQALLDNPHGIDLGAQEPRLPGVLRTASRRVELAPDEMLADLERLRARMRAEQPEMVLVGRRQLRSNNSWLHNVAPLVGGSNRCTLQIHPDDAVRLGLNGRAVVKSAAGTLTVEVEPTEDIMPGVVSLPHGWGHGDSAQSVARAHAGVNANALTDDSLVDVPSGNAVFNGVPVTLTRA